MREKIDSEGLEYGERLRILEDLIYRQGEEIEQLREEIARIRKKKE